MARKSARNSATKRVYEAPTTGASARFQANVYPDIWATFMKLKVDGHPFTMEGREYQVPIIRDESEWIVMPKGAQMGLTTVFLVRTFHWMLRRKWHHLYLLPLKTGAKPFTQRRVDSIMESNSELHHMFKNVDNALHKQTRDDIALMIRGTNIWTELREIPSDVIVFDERDKMVEDNIPEAMARLDGSMIRRVTELSTPTVPGHGVDAEDAWHASDQHRWYVPCPHCSRRQTFTFEENVVVGDEKDECYLRCKHCHKAISDAERAAANAFGTWEPDNLNGSKRGYHINQLHSPTQTIPRFMDNYFLGQTDKRKLRAWHNNNLGEPYVAFGDQVTPEIIQKVVARGFTTGGIPVGPLRIGIDVGNVLHVRADALDQQGRRIPWAFKIFTDKPGSSMWDQLDAWLSGLGTWVAVCDAHPEKSEAKKLALKYHKRFWIGFEKDTPDQAETARFNKPKPGETGKVDISRTDAFDAVIARFMEGRIIMPADVMQIGEHMPNLPYNGYVYQLGQMVRVEEEDAKGRIVARWVKNKNPDHWHHADMFCEMACHAQVYTNITPDVGDIFKAAGNLIAA